MGDILADTDGDDKWMDQSSARLFEKSRIKVLQGMCIVRMHFPLCY